MATEKILFTDGGDVVVTDSTLRVRSHQYRLTGIKRHSFSIMKPNRIPGVFIIGIGLIALTIALNGNLKLSNLTIQLASIVMEFKVLLLIGGSISILAGIILLIATKEKYGVHIVTEQGEKDVLVSDRKVYVSLVVEALNKAFINGLGKTERDIHNPRMGMSVSHR